MLCALSESSYQWSAKDPVYEVLSCGPMERDCRESTLYHRAAA
ncbi:MAG: hypothetical protein AAF490_16135 [Chloroflexota bacterium]